MLSTSRGGKFESTKSCRLCLIYSYVPGCCWRAYIPLRGGKFESIKNCHLCLTYVPGCCWLACTTWWRKIWISQKLSSLPYICTWLLLASVYHLVAGNLNLSKIVVFALYIPGCCWLACTTWWREIWIYQKLSSLPYLYLAVVGERVPLGGWFTTARNQLGSALQDTKSFKGTIQWDF